VIDTIDLEADDKTVVLQKKEPTLSTVVSQTLSIIEYRLAIENLKEADIAITPFSGNIGFWQFNRASEAITAGEIAARLTLQRSEEAQRLLKHYQSKMS
jgi:predicted acylesterase/phospholipase RssA